jgi:hypothetical protein
MFRWLKAIFSMAGTMDCQFDPFVISWIAHFNHWYDWGRKNWNPMKFSSYLLLLCGSAFLSHAFSRSSFLELTRCHSKEGRISIISKRLSNTLKLRGGIGEAIDIESISARGLSDILETYEKFGEGPSNVDQSGTTFEAKPDFFNQSENRMDGESEKVAEVYEVRICRQTLFAGKFESRIYRSVIKMCSDPVFFRICARIRVFLNIRIVSGCLRRNGNVGSSCGVSPYRRTFSCPRRSTSSLLTVYEGIPFCSFFVVPAVSS